MKRFDRWLSILMCICLLCTSMPADLASAYAEGELEAIVSEINEMSSTGEAETEAELTLGTEEAPAEVLQEAEPAAAEAEAPLTFGYAKAVQDAVLSADSAGEMPIATLSVNGIVLVTERIAEGENDRMKVAFVYEGAAEEGWVDAAALIALSEEEIAAFQGGITEAICYQDDVNYPLPEPMLVLPEVTAEPEVTVEPEPSEEAEEGETVEEPSVEEPSSEEDTSESEVTEEIEATIEPEITAEPEPTQAPEASEVAEPETESEKAVETEDSEGVVMMQTDLYIEAEPAESDEAATIENEAAAVTMQLAQQTAELTVGDIFELNPTFSDGVSRGVFYTTDASGIVDIDAAAGTVAAVAPGTVTVTAKCTELADVSAVIVITVVEKTENEGDDSESEETIEITVKIENTHMIVGESQPISCALPEGIEGTVLYTLSDENVLSMNEDGSIAALTEGECVITATLMQGETAAAAAVCTVYTYTVEELNASLATRLMVGESADVTVDLPEGLMSRVEFSSAAEEIASVDANGTVTAAAPGEASIWVTLGEMTAELTVEVCAPAVDFELSVDKNVMNLGDSAQLSVKLPEYSTGTASFASLNALVAAVDPATGLVMTVGPGKVELTATIGDVTKSVTVEVYSTPSVLNLTIEEDTLPVGYYTQASVDLSEYLIAEITYQSSDTSIAEIDENGVITAIAPGYCDIIAVADNGVQASAEFHVTESAVDLNVKYHEMSVGQTFSLTHTVNDEALASATAVFGSSNTEIATVDPATGLVKAVSDGEVIITLTLSNSGATAKCYVTVHKAPTRIAITSATKTIGVKQITGAIGYALYAGDEPTIGTVKFKSSNTGIVQVNAKGQMKGIKAGTATITVTTYNGVPASFKVTVKKAPSKLTIKPTSTVLAVGQSTKISYALTSNTAAGMTFTSSDKNVVIVDAVGNVKAVGQGTAKIKVSTHNGLNKYASITVNKAPENVTLSLSSAKIGVDMTATAKGAVDTSSKVAFTYEYWTDKPEIISVNATTGAIKALSVGEANVFVRTYNGVTSHEADGERIETSAKINVVPKPDNVAIDGKEFNIIVGKIIKLPVKMTMNDGSTECLTTYKLSTSNKKIAAVNSSGQVKGVKAGTATITLTAANGDVVTCKVVVMKNPTKVVLNKSSLTIGEEMTSSLAAKVYYSSSKYYTHASEDALGMGKFSSSNTSVVKIDPATGAITAVAPGSAKLTYKTLNGKSASCKVTVLARPTEIDMNVDTLKLGVDMTGTLKAVYKNGELGPVTFSSSNPEFATVHETSGKVTAVAVGTTTITIDAGNGVTNTCEVTVVPKPDNVAIDGKEFNIIVGKIIKLPVKMTMNDGSTECLTTYKLSTSNKKIAAVNSSGQVKGVKAGTATITLTAANGDVVTCKVVVMKNPTKVVLNKSSLKLGVGMTSSLAARVYYSSSKYYTHASEDALGMGAFSSTNTSVVKIDPATGAISAVGQGTATVGYKTLNGKYATCKVTVHAAPTSLNLSSTEIELGEKMSAALSVAFNENEYGPLTFTSSNPECATVNSSGKITGVSYGETTIVVSTLNDVAAVCNVKVQHGPDKVRLNVSSSNMAVKGKITLKPTATYLGSTEECMTTFTYKSSNTKVATVTSAGVVKGVKAGSATIRVTAANGAYADCKIVVRKTPTKVIFQSSKVSLGVGQRISVPGKIYFSGGSCIYQPGDTSYAKLSIDDTTIAKLDSATGEVIGVEVGRTYLRLTTYNGKTVKCRIDVGPGPEWISLDNAIMTLGREESKKLNCSQSAGSVTDITYESSDSDIVKVSGSGASCTITAIGQGTATITATSSNGKTSTCQVTVMAKPEAIAFESNSICIGMNETAALPEVVVSSSEGECSQAVAYSVTGTAVAMNAPGYVTGMKAGTAVVTAKTSNGLTATCEVTVQPEPTEITLASEHAEIAVGDTTQLTLKMNAAGSYVYSVDDPSVLHVSASGVVTALNPGTATITATAYNDRYATCTIKVLAVPSWVRVDSDEVTVGAGAEHQLAASIPENTLGVIAFASSNENAATVDENGLITAIAPGTAVIRAYIAGHESVFDTCNVTVLAKPTKIVISDDEMTLRKGAEAKLEAVFSCDSGEDCYGTASYVTSNENVAAVDQNGAITAVGAGEAIITVSLDSDENISAACKVIVAETSVGFDVNALSLSIGERYALRIDLPEGENNFSLTSTPEGIVTVNPETYEIEAVGEGTAVITAVNGSDTAECTVTVTQKPEAIELAATEKRIVIGKSFALNAQLLPAGTAAKLTYTTTDDSIAEVSADGVVKAVGYGDAVITVSNHDGSLIAQCEIKAVYEPEMIRFGELEDIVIAVGDSYVLETPVMYNSNGDCDSTYTLAISNSACASLSVSSGRYIIRALNEGDATLRLKTANGKTAVHTVHIVEALESIAFETPVIYAAVGEKFTPAVYGSNGAAASVSIDSDSDCVVVNADGSLLAVSEGTAVITAVSENFAGLSASAKVEVRKAPASISLNPSSMKLAVGEYGLLIPEYDSGAASASVVFSSSDETIIRAGRDGSVLAVGSGTAVVTASAFGGVTAECEITVKEAPTALSILPASISACVEDVVQLTAEFASAAEYANLTYESDNESVAVVSEDGVVTFLSVGETVIYVSTFNGLAVEVPVVVSETPSGVSFDPESAVILSGDSAKLNIVFDKGAGYFTLTSKDPSVASVSADGTVHALKAGTTTITLDMPGLNLSSKCELTVVDELEGITVSAEKTTLELHETTQLSYALAPANAIGSGLVVFVSSDPEVAKVDRRTGLVTGMSYGTAVITASTADGRTAQCEINVLGGKRRMMIAYYFGEPGDSGYLPFAYNNGYSMYSAFAASTIEGQQYDIKGPMSNAPKAELFGALESHFADATEDDVSVIYICAHGSGSYGPTGEYAFALDSTHYVTASELMNALERIKGRVVLIMDSCHSGGVIDCNKSRLDAQGGRISIIASSHRNTNSCYWNVSEKFTSVDFYTHALLQGIGFNESNGIGGARGWTIGYEPADTAGDGNGQVDLTEMFSYAKSVTMANVKKYQGYSQFHGNPAQTPQSYIGSMNEDLVMFAW